MMVNIKGSLYTFKANVGNVEKMMIRQITKEFPYETRKLIYIIPWT